jgi:hypothetical protein
MKITRTLSTGPLLVGSLLATSAMAQAPGQPSAVIKVDCDYDCLIGYARNYMAALEDRDFSSARIAPDVIFSENDVVMPVGNDGVWGTISKVREGEMTIADEETGNAAWFGLIEEHGNPAYYAMRIQVEDGLITEIETIVNRLPDMPKPFGNPDMVSHDPVWNDILPPEQQRSRERLVAVADGYFSTVELNDGDIFTQFDPDCGRLENGVLTTAGSGAGGGTAATIASGCEPQLRLGIYRINKRIRNRRYPLIDVKRGVILGTGFFDHANTFDRYTLNDGREMQTVLKWPNSISLLEAFKIRNGKIWRIEAVFTYVPYFMPSPFAVGNPDYQTR